MALGRLVFLALVSCILAEDPKIYFVEKFEGELLLIFSYLDLLAAWTDFSLSFTDESYTDRWVESTFKGSDAGKFKWTAGKFYNDADLDKGKNIYFYLNCYFLEFISLLRDLLAQL